MMLLLTALLADGINLGLTKRAESCPGVTYSKLSWLQAWHIRDKTYSAAFAVLVNTQLNHAFAANWEDDTTSSSDGQHDIRQAGSPKTQGTSIKNTVPVREKCFLRTFQINIHR